MIVAPVVTDRETLQDFIDSLRDYAPGIEGDLSLIHILTESFAMTPAAAVSGFYLAHPQARYFAVSKIAGDQLADWAQRAGFSVPEAQRWLAPLL